MGGVASTEGDDDSGASIGDSNMGPVGHARFIIDNKGDIKDFYHISARRLGEGSFARVVKCHNKSTGASRAVKIAKKSSSKRKNDLVWYEITIMKMLDHPNLLKIFEHFEDRKHIYAIIELCQGGELHDLVVAHGHLSESQSAHIMNQVFRAVFYMHTSQICHRDLKPENVMLSRQADIEQAVVKIIDFGHARVFQKGVMMTTKCGAVYYVSPQVLAGRYDQSTDMWTCGVLLYILICGYPPFSGGNDAEILSKVRLGNYSFAASDWRHVTLECKDLVRGLLKINPKDRTKAKEAMLSDWIENHVKNKIVPMNLRIIESFRKFRSMGLLKKASLHLIGAQIDEDVIKPLRDIFVALDWSGDGLISASELRMGFRKCGVTAIPDDLDEVMQDLDIDGSGEIDYSEFVAATLDPAIYTKEEVCWSAFRIFDRDGDGIITPQELRNALNNGSPEEICDIELAEDMIKEVDENGDMSIHFNEFVKMMKGLSQPFVDKTEKERARDERKRKKKEGMLKIELATQAAHEARGRQTYKGLAGAVTRQLVSFRKSFGGGAFRRTFGGSVHQTGRQLERLLDDVDQSQYSGDRGKLSDRRSRSRKSRGVRFLASHMGTAQVDIERHVGLNVLIKSAKIKSAEALDLWVICEVPELPDQKFNTEEVTNTNTPLWNYEGTITKFRQQDTLQFTVMDHPMAPPIGRCEISAGEVMGSGFFGEVKLRDKKKGVGFLYLDIEVVDLQAVAATKLQATWRGRQARHEVQQLREERQDEGIDISFDIGDEGHSSNLRAVGVH